MSEELDPGEIGSIPANTPHQEERLDAADISWEPSGLGLVAEWWLLYEDRPLKWWERVKMLFTRRDPRVLGEGPQ